MSALQRLKERKLVQWTVAYLAGAWLLLEVFLTLQEGLGWSPRVFPVLVGALVVGLVVTLVLAWYHGEQGRQRVSGPELLIIGGILLVAAVLTPLLFGPDQPGPQEAAAPAESTSGPAARSEWTIAVLPFRNVSGHAGDEPFVAGIHDEVLNQLYKIRSLETRSPQSVLAYRDSEKAMPTIGEELDVQYLVDGNVRRVGEEILINVRLFDGPADRRLWGETYERRYTVENVLELQRRIAIDVATRLGAEILPSERGQLAVEPPESMTAYELYLEGLYHFREGLLSPRGTREPFLRARDALQEVIAAEPEWAPGWAALGRVYQFLAAVGEPWEETMRWAREALDRAISLDSLHAPAWASHGWVLHTRERDFEGAEDAHLRAFDLGWRLPWDYAVLLVSVGRFSEAIDAFERAIVFDRSLAIRQQLPWAYVCAGDYDTASELFRRLVREGQGEHIYRDFAGYAYLKAGYPEEGLALIPEMGDAGKALSYALADSTERAEEYLAAAEDAPPVWTTGTLTAAAAVLLGDPDRALDNLERVLDQAPHFGIWYQCLEEVRSLEGNPRYEAVLERVGFPPREREKE